MMGVEMKCLFSTLIRTVLDPLFCSDFDQETAAVLVAAFMAFAARTLYL